MPTYIILARWTNRGLERIKESATRLDAGRKTFEADGIKMKEFYLVMGRYDMLTIAEAPDDATFARGILSVASKGYLQTETLRAFTEQEYEKILSGIS